jgi:rfaE bifunctional protein nucleotidyltransferase chain/domain
MYKHKIRLKEDLVSILDSVRENNKKIVFTNGCFDLLHAGHIQYLNQARQLGDVLIVAVNSDRSVKALKGNNRPILPEQDRLVIIASLCFVNYVVLFDEDTPYDVISVLKPDILVKGGDYKPEDVVGKDIVEEYDGEVVIIPYEENKSTTDIIEKIKEL